MTRIQLMAQPADVAGGWAPECWLGAPAPGGLALPAARPTLSWLYGPRGVCLDSDHLVVADSGNHRVLVWHGVPQRDEQPAHLVLGQPDPVSEGPAAGGRGPERGMHLPTGVLVHDSALLVADAWHHRILIWDEVPQRGDQPPDRVLGQPDVSSVEPNRGGQPSACSMYWPFGISVVAGSFYVADTGNRRVLGWSGGVPASADVPADLILGQQDAIHRGENRGGRLGADSFRWPHALTGDADVLLVADPGNHRVLGWRPPPDADCGADLLLGQQDFHSTVDSPYGPRRGDRFHFPYSAAMDGSRLAIADTGNNRVLMWDGVPTARCEADAVLGQPTLQANGENRWSSVAPDTLCWPYGVSLHGDRLAVADTGNNRVTVWRRR